MATATSTATTAPCWPRRWAARAGSANYSLAADLNGDGKVDQQDAVILASDYGFHATTAAVPSTPPARPVFDLDVNSDTAPVGDGMTTQCDGDPGRPDRPERDGHPPADRRRHQVEPQRPVRLLRRAAGRRRQCLHRHRHECGRRQQPVHQDHHPHPAGSEPDRRR